MKWITREKVKVDRVACPWLIKRFIDPQAEFVFVAPNQVEAKARELGATAFDIEGCELGHHGLDVSFNSILKKYKLTDPALGLLGDHQTLSRGARLLMRNREAVDNDLAIGGGRVSFAGVRLGNTLRLPR